MQTQAKGLGPALRQHGCTLFIEDFLLPATGSKRQFWMLGSSLFLTLKRIGEQTVRHLGLTRHLITR
jgi:hypothetical protein